MVLCGFTGVKVRSCVGVQLDVFWSLLLIIFSLKQLNKILPERDVNNMNNKLLYLCSLGSFSDPPRKKSKFEASMQIFMDQHERVEREAEERFFANQQDMQRQYLQWEEQQINQDREERRSFQQAFLKTMGDMLKLLNPPPPPPTPAPSQYNPVPQQQFNDGGNFNQMSGQPSMQNTSPTCTGVNVAAESSMLVTGAGSSCPPVPDMSTPRRTSDGHSRTVLGMDTRVLYYQ